MTVPARVAWALLLPGVPLCLALIFAPDELQRSRDVLAWRERSSPWAYLEQHPWGLYRDAALAEIDRLQRPSGLVSRLLPPPRTGRLRPAAAQVQSAAFDPEEQQLVTGSGSVAVRWEVASGRLLEEIGPARRRDVADGQTWGYGFGEVAWTDGGRTVVGLTSGPHVLWFMRGDAAPERLALGGHGIGQLSSRDGRLGWLRSLEHGAVLPLPGDMPFTLPHEEVTAMALAGGGRAVTASRRSIQWWQEAARVRTLPITAQGNPVAFSADARWALAPVHRSLELWSTERGERVLLELDREVRAVCASDTHLAAGTDDGQVHLWSLGDWRPLRSFRSSAEAIGILVCGQQHLLAVGDHQTDARVWHLDGKAQHAPIPEAPPPPLSWLVRQAADGQWARQHPQLVGWLEDAADGPWRWFAPVVLVLLLAAVQVLGRRR